MDRDAIKKRLNAITEKDSRRLTWMDKISDECKKFVNEAVDLYFGCELNIETDTQFHRYLERIISEDFEKDSPKWPRRDRFGKWLKDRRLAREKEASEAKDPKRQPTVSQKSQNKKSR